MIESSASTEVWKDIPDYEDFYQVSSKGRVYSKRQKKIMRVFEGTGSYLYIGLRKKYRSRLHLLHRLMAQAFLENINFLSDVDHVDQNKKNNELYNLKWCSRSENAKTYNNFLAKDNSKNEKMILFPSDVEHIRFEFYTEKSTLINIARGYNIGMTTARKALKKITWKEVC